MTVREEEECILFIFYKIRLLVERRHQLFMAFSLEKETCHSMRTLCVQKYRSWIT